MSLIDKVINVVQLLFQSEGETYSYFISKIYITVTRKGFQHEKQNFVGNFPQMLHILLGCASVN